MSGLRPPARRREKKAAFPGRVTGASLRRGEEKGEENALGGAGDFAADGKAPEAENETGLLPGAKPVLEFLRSSPERADEVYLRKGRRTKEKDEIADLCRSLGLRFTLLDAPAFARIYPGPCAGAAARIFPAGFISAENLLALVPDAPLPLALMLDRVQDPGNAGALARTLYALGGAGLILPRHGGVYLGGAAAKAASGALEKLPVAKARNLGQCLDMALGLGFTLYGTCSAPSGGAASPPVCDALREDLRFPAVLVLGSEEAGLRPGLGRRCSRLLHIPMPRPFDSLNVAQAGAMLIGCFAACRQRGDVWR
ncbi:MAG: 23S rRNA (guanosine(2251)-2'-O)-methyltransferase RlmB [Desulfovibrio sp.]|nr:23S rRNA (guanosine(2251)-2'-O)-methyltransferase RlmB [Desulfovibrio sp.]